MAQFFFPTDLPKPRKRFGQHFLVDKTVIKKIVQSMDIEPNEVVLEIGPGRGALTEGLFIAKPSLYAVEFDRDLVEYLPTKFPQLQLFSQDALDFDYQKIFLINQKQKYQLVGNLPYNVATPLLFQFIKYINCFSVITIMVQKEVAQRILADVTSADYGRLSVMCKYFFRCAKVVEVAPGAFNPPPKVRSMVIKLTPRSAEEINQCNAEILEELVKSAFAMRRKKLSNTLKKYFSINELNKIGMEFNINALADLRAENVPLAVYIKLTQIRELL